ncbi:hypothetical protein D9M72_521780 [compost metagenome]
MLTSSVMPTASKVKLVDVELLPTITSPKEAKEFVEGVIKGLTAATTLPSIFNEFVPPVR